MITQTLKENHAAKWIAGVAATGTLGTAQGALVQIDLINNNLLAGEGSNINLDFTGSGGTDMTSGAASTQFNPGSTLYSGFFSANNGSATLYAYAASSSGGFGVGLSSTTMVSLLTGATFSNSTAQGGSGSGFFPITIDLSGTGGDAAQEAFLFLSVGGQGNTRGVTLESVIWDDTTTTRPAIGAVQAGPILSFGSTENGIFTPTVPEPSSLALLALGAAGVVTRRRRKTAV